MQQEKIIHSMINKNRGFKTRFLFVGELETNRFCKGNCISVGMDYDQVFFRLSNFETILVDSGALFINGRHVVLAPKTNNKISEQYIGRTIRFEIKYKEELEEFCAKTNKRLNSLELTADEIHQIQEQYISNLKNGQKSRQENAL